MRALLLAAWCLSAFGQSAKDPASLVNPFIGTGNLGHTFPGATLPFGMVQPSPDTRLKGWGSCGGYVYTDPVIFGFSQTHLSGVGIPDYGDILLLPATGPVKWRVGYLGTSEEAPGFDSQGYGSRYDKASERAAPGSYAVVLKDYGVKAELTATTRVAFHRYTFQRAQGAHVFLDLSHHDLLLEYHLRIVDDHTVTGLRRSKAWAKNQPVYFVATFDHAFRAELGGDPLRAELRPPDRAALHFKVRPGEQVLAKVAISAVDEAGAQRNLEELPGWDFDATRASARKIWNQHLGRVEVEGGTHEQQRIFYTALYHTMIQPNTFQDADGRYLGRDMKVHQAEGWTQHTVFSLWDTYRAAHPLYTLLQPTRDLEFIRTFLAEYRDGGRLPVWELWANETNCMIGYHAVPVIVDAWMKGLRGFDADLALAAMRHSADENSRGLEAYRQHGYIPAEAEPESVSKTLEYAYDDWCIGIFAQDLGKPNIAKMYFARAQAWQHMLDPEGFFHPRQNGMWVAPFNPLAVTFHFTEATPWQYAFSVPQDLNGFIRRLGGADRLGERLDGLFAASSKVEGWEEEDVTGLLGQYAHGNEPSHHIAYLYPYAGQPWKTQARVRQLMDELHHDRPDGLCGNEDCGQMSAWYVFSALGFYPVCPGRPEYVVGSPCFTRATIHLPNGKNVVIRAEGQGKDRPYIQSATWDGKPFTTSWILHEQLLQGGEWTFVMGSKPSAWGSSEADRPRSGGEGEPVVPAPTVAGEALFQGSTRMTFLGEAVHYTLDGSLPTEASPVAQGPLTLDRSATLRFRAKQGGAWSPVVETRLTRLPDWPSITVATPIHPTFRAEGPLTLIDGLHGTTDFRAGHWLGVFGEDLKATLDLGEVKPLHRLSMGFLQDAYTWTYFPKEVRFECSEDGQSWATIGKVVSGPELQRYGPHLHDGQTETHDYVIEGAWKARYIRVVAISHRTIPKGSWKEGSPCFLCADEVLIQ
jgi:predicted alpha-1,2-mannosidase